MSILYHQPMFYLSCSVDGVHIPQKKVQTQIVAVKSSSTRAEIWLPVTSSYWKCLPSNHSTSLSPGGPLTICPWLSQIYSPLSFKFVYLGLLIVPHLTFSQDPLVNRAALSLDKRHFCHCYSSMTLALLHEMPQWCGLIITDDSRQMLVKTGLMWLGVWLSGGTLD